MDNGLGCAFPERQSSFARPDRRGRLSLRESGRGRLSLCERAWIGETF